jgi:hypothetical protein
MTGQFALALALIIFISESAGVLNSTHSDNLGAKCYTALKNC